jgi:hypothetical protein
MNQSILQEVGNSWTSWATTSFSKRTVLHGVSQLPLLYNSATKRWCSWIPQAAEPTHNQCTSGFCSRIQVLEPTHNQWRSKLCSWIPQALEHTYNQWRSELCSRIPQALEPTHNQWRSQMCSRIPQALDPTHNQCTSGLCPVSFRTRRFKLNLGSFSIRIKGVINLQLDQEFTYENSALLWNISLQTATTQT